MKKLLLAIALVVSCPAFAADTAANEASIRELLDVTDSKKLIEGVYTQMDGVMEQAMKKALDGKPVTPEQEKVMAEYRAKVVAITREELAWSQLEPVYIDLYSKTFSQAELDGMLKFYRSEPGKAVIAKMPLMMSNLMQTMTTHMQSIMPRIMNLAEEYVPKIQAAGK
jgi:uncharacterized protein